MSSTTIGILIANTVAVIYLLIIYYKNKNEADK